ncbi:hypothetical protein [Escherichia phage phiWec179]|nr:hypothetical protein [Escherichia phage phiWec179]BDU12421.1 hypothetical protein [Escherichia phage phiWec181]BDU12861.1 hypothetical protein [Escherichia phage phiWec186]
MSKVIRHEKLSPTLSISECNDGYWLYDETRGMNLAMQAKTEQMAYVQALEYYQRRLQEVESNYNNLKAKVDHFISQVADDDDDHYCERCGSYS